jgi:CheY-like chemotaxis protein/anti-sigma regulatory factor (Ser/Thr protein kinase)
LERANLISSLQVQTEQLRNADRLKDEFLAVLSHELRNPLNPILGWAQLLRFGELDADTTQIAVDTIERNARLQSQLIEDLLDISRIMRGKMTLNAEPVLLATVIEAALETVQLAAEVKQIQIEVALEAVAAVSGDAGRLQQVIWNLLSNAVKFTNPSGQIEIQLTQVESVVQVQVTDNGKGINPEFVPYVFEYFRQQDGSTTRSFGGLGLGLAIARQIVEMHGGIIWAESEGEGQGASFVVQLPALNTVEVNPTEQAVKPIPELSLTGLCFLVVDDDVDARDFLLYLLESNGAEVTLATSAAEALELLRELRPDAMLSDIGMPGIDGYELVRTIRASELNQNLPVIAITAYAGEMNQQQALSAGFDRHIAKPINIKQLIGTMLEIVRSGESE